jgi:G:T-mismatch repair DNA endonuclease (very short patch repair protein)
MSDTDLFLLVDKFYKEFISDESIIGIESLLKRNGIGSKRRVKIRRAMYEKYGEEKLKKIYRHRQALCRQNCRSKDYRHSEETKEKIKKSNSLFWETATDDRRESSRKSMIKNCFGKNQTREVKSKRIRSRRIGAGWHKHSTQSKLKMSEIFLMKWRRGDYNDRAKSFPSQSQRELMREVELLGYTVREEYEIIGKPFDIFIEEKNLLIEFNGTYWHLDPRIYDENHYDKSRDVYAKELWRRDKEKLDSARKLGYNVLVVWEKDWAECKNKSDYTKQILC